MAGEAGDGKATPGGTGSTSSPFVFRGVTQLALDAKGRLAIPAKHRTRWRRRATDGWY